MSTALTYTNLYANLFDFTQFSLTALEMSVHKGLDMIVFHLSRYKLNDILSICFSYSIR